MPSSTATKSSPTPTIERIIGREMMKSLFLRGFSRITLRLGGSEASASAAKVSMIRLTHSICVTVSGNSLPKIEPNSTMMIATKLIVSWNSTNRWMLRYSERPHITAVAMLLNESSSSVMSLASLATEVPVPIDSPTCAKFSAGASFVPSPVTATTSPFCCSSLTSRCLSSGRARDMIFNDCTRSSSSSSLSAANSEPVMWLRSVSSAVHRPICRPISLAVAGVSPVTIFTSMPADKHSATAAGTSSRTGSEMAAIPMKCSGQRSSASSQVSTPSHTA